MLEKLRHGWLLLTGKEDLSLNQQMIKVENVHINMPGINGESQSLLAEPHRCIKEELAGFRGSEIGVAASSTSQWFEFKQSTSPRRASVCHSVEWGNDPHLLGLLCCTALINTRCGPKKRFSVAVPHGLKLQFTDNCHHHNKRAADMQTAPLTCHMPAEPCTATSSSNLSGMDCAIPVLQVRRPSPGRAPDMPKVPQLVLGGAFTVLTPIVRTEPLSSSAPGPAGLRHPCACVTQVGAC